MRIKEVCLFNKYLTLHEGIINENTEGMAVS